VLSLREGASLTRVVLTRKITIEKAAVVVILTYSYIKFFTV